jgi:tRNA threonylcarbamoyladenosine biosynthesis protein TsaE
VSRTSRCTEQVAEALAREARVGDVVCLHGDVGAGKSVLSRAFVRAVTDDQSTEVPSPTFLLQQVRGFPNHHVPPP